MALPGTTSDQMAASPSYAQMARPYPTTYFTPNRSRIWRTGNCPFSAFFVFDEENIPSSTFMRAARETYPLEVAYGIIFTKENGRNVAEVALSSEKFVDHAVTEGIKVGKSTLLGTRPLRPQAKVTRVSVSDIPMLTPNMKQVQHDLQTSMSRFGTVLEASLFNDPNGGWFRGRGMVYLDVACADRELEALSHVIPWAQSDRSFHAVWNQMPTFCRYCHKEGHNRQDCPIRPRSDRKCWTCNQPGHVTSACPREPTPTSHKKPRVVLPTAPSPPSPPSPTKAPSNPYEVLSSTQSDDDLDPFGAGACPDLQEQTPSAQESLVTPRPDSPISVHSQNTVSSPAPMVLSISNTSYESRRRSWDQEMQDISMEDPSTLATTASEVNVPTSQDSVTHLLDDTIASMAKRTNPVSPPVEPAVTPLRRSTRQRKSPTKYE
jgi:hypothetical protein